MEIDNTHSEAECLDLLHKIFNSYPGFLKTYLPNGWSKSECVNFFHPTAEQQLKEYKIINENTKRISKNKSDDIEFTISDFEQDLSEVNEEKEPITLLGLCIWDVFSNNHTVRDKQNKEYDLGSFRGSARMIASLINGKNNVNDVLNFDYAEFYMGTIWINSRGNLQPFYEFIFSILKKEDYDWEYAFPKMSIIKFEKDEIIKPEDYNPEVALMNEIENKKVDEFQKELDRIHDDEFEDAKHRKPSSIVLAYQQIFGQFPNGHPQKNL